MRQASSHFDPSLNQIEILRSQKSLLISPPKQKSASESEVKVDVYKRKMQWQVSKMLVVNTNHCRSELDTVQYVIDKCGYREAL